MDTFPRDDRLPIDLDPFFFFIPPPHANIDDDVFICSCGYFHNHKVLRFVFFSRTNVNRNMNFSVLFIFVCFYHIGIN